MPLFSFFTRRPHAVFSPIAASQQADVAARVQRSVATYLKAQSGAGPPSASPSVSRLLAHVGDARFYDVVATLEPSHANDWREMGKVQRAFHDAEPRFDAKTRAYSESMRLTLHAALIQHVADPSDRLELFEMFLELHVTAFHENGGWIDNMHIGLMGALDVVKATPMEMIYHADELAEGAFVTDAATVRAAQWVREARTTVS